jgi:hypothetical protein
VQVLLWCWSCDECRVPQSWLKMMSCLHEPQTPSETGGPPLFGMSGQVSLWFAQDLDGESEVRVTEAEHHRHTPILELVEDSEDLDCPEIVECDRAPSSGWYIASPLVLARETRTSDLPPPLEERRSVLRSRLRSRDGEERRGLRSRPAWERSGTRVLLPCPFGLSGPAEPLRRVDETVAPPGVKTTVVPACPFGLPDPVEPLCVGTEGMAPPDVTLTVLPACPFGLSGPAE